MLAGHTWSRDPGIDNAASNWPLYEGEQGFADKTVLRRVELQVAGATLEAEYRVFLKEPLAEIVVFGNKFDESFCTRFSEWSNPMFGPPAKVIDMSLPRRKDGGYIQFEADWLLGVTRVQFSCVGLRIGDSFVPAIATLLYRHQTMLKPLEDLIYIECSSTKKYVGRLAGDRAAKEEEAPTGFIINPNDNSVRRWDKRTLGKTQRFSDEEIVTTWDRAIGRVECWRADVRVRWPIHGFRRGPQSGSHGHVSSTPPKIRTSGFPQYGSKSRRVSVSHALPAEPLR